MFLNILDKHAALKRKLLRANHSTYIANLLWEAILRRSYLQKQIWKKIKTYKKQKSIFSRLYKKDKKHFFNNLSRSFVTDNNLFWKTVKPYFSSNGNYRSQIKLVENQGRMKLFHGGEENKKSITMVGRRQKILKLHSLKCPKTVPQRINFDQNINFIIF